MTPIGSIRKKITSAGQKGAQNLRAAVIRATSRAGRASYAYIDPPEDVLRTQEDISARLMAGEAPAPVLGSSFYLKPFYAKAEARPPLFSLFLAAREPDLRLFKGTLDSVLAQTYRNFEIYVLDMGISDQVRDVVAWHRDDRLHYLDVADAKGFIGVLNRAAAQAAGDYILRLDCGDLLTRDALFEMALAVMQTEGEILYTDEDRRDARGKHFSDPYCKPDFSIDYLYAADYVSKALLIRRSLFLALRFREEYEAAPEYDLVLRAPKSGIHHIPRVLCHVCPRGNPSPSPADCADARRRALEDYFHIRGIRAAVRPSRAQNLMEIDYLPDIFTARQMVGVVGGKVLDDRHRIIGGMQDARGNVLFEGWDEAEEGPRCIAQTPQNAYAVDVRCMKIRPELQELYREVFGVPYDGHVMHADENLTALSRSFCARVREMGYTIVWNPLLTRVVRS